MSVAESEYAENAQLARRRMEVSELLGQQARRIVEVNQVYHALIAEALQLDAALAARGVIREWVIPEQGMPDSLSGEAEVPNLHIVE